MWRVRSPDVANVKRRASHNFGKSEENWALYPGEEGWFEKEAAAGGRATASQN